MIQDDVQSNEDVMHILKTELEEKNKQIENLQELLKNQQILSLESNKEKSPIAGRKTRFLDKVIQKRS